MFLAVVYGHSFSRFKSAFGRTVCLRKFGLKRIEMMSTATSMANERVYASGSGLAADKDNSLSRVCNPEDSCTQMI